MRFRTERPLTWQACSECGNEALEHDPAPRCRHCGGLLEVQHHAPNLTTAELLARFTERRGAHRRLLSGVWRFREVVLPGATDPVTHPEGNTPLLHRPAVDDWVGVGDVLLKHEGHNPTGSFKDRGMTVGVTQAVRIGASAVACASTGNTAASMAAYAAQAGLPALVLVPAGQVALGKLAQALAYGARTLAVRGDFDDCLRLAEAASARLGVYLLNSINPFRIEGQKTVLLELMQQLSWEAPDWIAVPAGNLGNVSSIGKALRELRAWGVLRTVPRLVAVQAAGADPFARSFRAGFADRPRVRAATVATAIRIGDPASFPRAVQAIRETNGVVLSVSDPEILAAKAVIDGAGVGCEPASAAAVAGLRRLVAEGTIRPGERTVAILTGHVLKDPGVLLEHGANRAMEVDASLEAVEAALGPAGA